MNQQNRIFRKKFSTSIKQHCWQLSTGWLREFAIDGMIAFVDPRKGGFGPLFFSKSVKSKRIDYDEITTCSNLDGPVDSHRSAERQPATASTNGSARH